MPAVQCVMPAPDMHSCKYVAVHTCMQVSGRGLQQLLAPPMLVEVNAKAYCGDLEFCYLGITPAMQQRYDTLTAAYAQLCDSCRLAGRSMTTKLIRHFTCD